MCVCTQKIDFGNFISLASLRRGTTLFWDSNHITHNFQSSGFFFVLCFQLFTLHHYSGWTTKQLTITLGDHSKDNCNLFTKYLKSCLLNATSFNKFFREYKIYVIIQFILEHLHNTLFLKFTVKSIFSHREEQTQWTNWMSTVQLS